MATTTDIASARRMVDEELALTKIVSIEFEDDDRVVICARKDQHGYLGYYKLTLTARDGRLEWASDVQRSRIVAGDVRHDPQAHPR